LAGYRVTHLRTRPWAEVWRVEGPDGLWWLKINAADTRYEPRLLDVLARSGSALLPAVLTHPDQPWALIADAGASARELLANAEPEQRIGFWIDVLPAYAELQRTVPVAELHAASVPDLSPSALRTTFDTLVGDAEWFTGAVAPELDLEQWDRILASRSRLAAAARAGPARAGRPVEAAALARHSARLSSSSSVRSCRIRAVPSCAVQRASSSATTSRAIA